MKRPADLFSRAMSDEDFADTAVIGGVQIADVLAGRIHEWEIPFNVKRAFRLQYPNLHEGFVHAVQRLSDHPEKLRGLVNGIRGKLFEINYEDYLNHGHLANGLTAHLAHSATNPSWDISITDAHGHVNQLLQLKASAALEAAKHALEAHPNVDVVIPTDVLHHFGEQTDILGHLVDGHESLTHLDGIMDVGVGHAEAAATTFHIPYISFLVIALTTHQQYRNGRLTPHEAIIKMTQRASTSVLAMAAGWLAQAALHKTIVGIPVAMWTRWWLGKWFKKNDLRKVLDQRIIIIAESRAELANGIRGRVLSLPSDSLA